jgi:hypothetical protein
MNEQIIDVTDPTMMFGTVILKVTNNQKIIDNMKIARYLIL